MITNNKDNTPFEIIGIDHGNAQMKTANCCFQTSVVESSRIDPASGGVLEYKNEFYTLKNKRLPVETNKAEEESFFPLTLMAVAEELIDRNPTKDSYREDIVLAVGIPPSAFNAQSRSEWEDYFKTRMGGTTSFKYDGRSFTLRMIDCKCYPQAMVILMSKAAEIRKGGMNALLIDMGGYTTDFVVYDLDAPAARAFIRTSIDGLGMNAFYNSMVEQMQNRFHHKVTPSLIANALNPERTTAFSLEEKTFIRERADAYAKEMVTAVREQLPADYQDYRVYLAGGGCITLEPQILEHLAACGKTDGIEVIADVHANAKAYEQAYKKDLARKNRRG